MILDRSGGYETKIKLKIPDKYFSFCCKPKEINYVSIVW